MTSVPDVSVPGPVGLTRTAGAAQGLTIAFAAFFPIMAIISLAPAVPSILQHFQATPGATTLVPLMVTAPGIMVALLSPLAGWATDRYGRRRLILAATFLYGAFGMAPLFLNELPSVFASRLGVGITEAVILTVTNTLIGDYFEPNDRRKWLTVQGVIGPIFATAVLIASGVLTGRFWNGAFILYSIAFLVFAAMCVVIFEPRIVVRARSSASLTQMGHFPWGIAFRCCAVTLFTAVIYYVFIVQSGLAFAEVGIHSPDVLGGLIATASVGVPLGAITFNRLSKRWPVNYLIGTYLAFFAIGMVGMGISHDYRVMTACAFVQQMGAGMSVITLIFWITTVIPPAHRGRGMGMWVAAFFVGQFVSPLVFGATRAVGGGVLIAFLILGGVAALGATAAAVMRTRAASMT
jgi:MFS family permease